MTTKIGSLKKTSEIPEGAGWELAHTCRTWEDADRYRIAIAQTSSRSARVRYQQPNYLVEWRS